jgi:hypothetical protein
VLVAPGQRIRARSGRALTVDQAAEEIKARLARFLREIPGLDLNHQKTLITYARSQPTRFPGYHITVQHNDTRHTAGRRSANGSITLRCRRTW